MCVYYTEKLSFIYHIFVFKYFVFVVVIIGFYFICCVDVVVFFLNVKRNFI